MSPIAFSRDRFIRFEQLIPSNTEHKLHAMNIRHGREKAMTFDACDPLLMAHHNAMYKKNVLFCVLGAKNPLHAFESIPGFRRLLTVDSYTRNVSDQS